MYNNNNIEFLHIFTTFFGIYFRSVLILLTIKDEEKYQIVLSIIDKYN